MIYHDHVHQPFNDHTWQHIRTLTLHSNHSDTNSHEADLADALDQLMRRVHTGHATKAEQALLARTAQVPLPPARPVLLLPRKLSSTPKSRSSSSRWAPSGPIAYGNTSGSCSCFSAPRVAQSSATGSTREAVTRAFELLEHGWTTTRPGA
ncbi:hypothetical protein [Streptomyces sp. 147326]|uniref:hypothetical protein n=1 Tax=Streptomyces sp. 147326 TaxID=3074379 RepID=UPI003857760D